MSWIVTNRASVPDSPEVQRVVRLPRRDWRAGWGASNESLVAGLTDAFRRPGSTMTLRPVQAAMLSELHDCGGLVAPVGVGGGKTLPSFLFARAIGAERPLLLIPAKLRHKTQREFASLQQDWVLPHTRVESYEFLSREQNAHFLDNYQPDLIIADEGHKLKNPKAAVTRRVGRYVKDCRPAVVVMSGTFTRRSLMDYWHIMRWCLGDSQMPMPADWQEVMVWANALDVGTDSSLRTGPGALLSLCSVEDYNAAMEQQNSDALTAVRRAFMQRMTSTPGVVATVQSSVECSIYVGHVDAELDHLAPFFKQLREEWETPDGHPFMEAVDLWRHARELVCGFYYVWNPRPPEAWLLARRAWCKVVREILKHSRTVDTELQVVKAIDAGQHPVAASTLAEWRAIRSTFEPNVEPRWVDDTVLKIASKWLHDNNGICWVEHRAFGERLSKLAGVPYFGQGGMATGKRSIEDEHGPCVASIAANAEGRNLQRYSKNLIVSCPPSGSVLEQLLGRTHRPGQDADEVTAEIVLACIEQWNGLQRALKDARYIQDTTGQEQKLMLADIDVPSPDEVATFVNPLWA